MHLIFIWGHVTKLKSCKFINYILKSLTEAGIRHTMNLIEKENAPKKTKIEPDEIEL